MKLGTLNRPSIWRTDMSTISILGLNKAAVFAALYNNAQPQGMGFMQYDPKPMTVEDAQAIIDSGHRMRFDYVKGRVMKVDLSGDEFAPGLYDRDNGQGAAQKVIDTLKASGDPNNKVIASTHAEHAKVQALQTRARLDEETTFEYEGAMAKATLGLGDMKEHLAPKIDQVLKG